jgi:hypothetical protein
MAINALGAVKAAMSFERFDGHDALRKKRGIMPADTRGVSSPKNPELRAF